MSKRPSGAKRYARFLFNLIAKPYAAIEGKVLAPCERSMEVVAGVIDVRGKTVLDVGTGTGRWANCLAERGAVVTGIDFSENMLAEGIRRFGDRVDFRVADADTLASMRDGEYDIVTASYVLHGMRPQQRFRILNQMKRVAKEVVLVKDFHAHIDPLSIVLELFERSDYFRFVRRFEQEMERVFERSAALPVPDGSVSMYVGYKN